MPLLRPPSRFSATAATLTEVQPLDPHRRPRRKDRIPHRLHRVLQRELQALHGIGFYRRAYTACPSPRRYIRRYGIYSSRGRGLWSTKPYLLALAPQGETQLRRDQSAEPEPRTELPCSQSSSAWALITIIVEAFAEVAKVFGCDDNFTKEQSSRIGADGSSVEISDDFFLSQVLKA